MPHSLDPFQDRTTSQSTHLMFATSTVATATEALASQRSGSIGAMLQRSKKNNDRIEILHGRRRLSGLMWEETGVFRVL